MSYLTKIITIMGKIGSYIKYIRKQKRLSQEKIASKLGVSITAYSKIECGLTNVSFIRLEQIAHCLGISLTLLIDFYENGELTEESFAKYFLRYERDPEYVNQQNRIIKLEENLEMLRKAIDTLKEMVNNREEL